MDYLLSLIVGTATAIAFSLLSFTVVALSATAEEGDMVLVISYPWGPSPQEIIRRSHLSERHPERAAMGSFTQLSTDTDLGLLKENGAWMILNGNRLAELCSL